MFSVDVNLQNCGTINKLLRCSISNCNSKIPSFMFCVDVNLQDCSTINKLLRHSISTLILKYHFLLWIFMNFQGCTTIHKLWGRSLPYNNSEIPSFYVLD